MDYKDSAKLVYRKLVSSMVRDLVTFPCNMSLTEVAVELHLTLGQMSRIYHGVCSLSPERFLVLQALYSRITCISSCEDFIDACNTAFALPLHGID